MSLIVLKAGLLDTIQDSGRKGYQHLGINTGGVMDPFSAALANGLLGLEPNTPVLELHFPAPILLFRKEAVICLTGADFRPVIGARALPLNQPVAVGRNSFLSFTGWESGARAYLAFLPGLRLDPWLGSCSTHLSAGAGGWLGRKLEQGDELPFSEAPVPSFSLTENSFRPLPWKAEGLKRSDRPAPFLIGSEWSRLRRASRAALEREDFQLLRTSNRMGYRLKGRPLNLLEETPMISSPVSFGTVQLLPDGQLAVLMADHQTTGGYPVVAYIHSAHLPRLAQMRPGDRLRFRRSDGRTAEESWLQQRVYLQDVQKACALKWQQL